MTRCEHGEGDCLLPSLSLIVTMVLGERAASTWAGTGGSGIGTSLWYGILGSSWRKDWRSEGFDGFGL